MLRYITMKSLVPTHGRIQYHSLGGGRNGPCVGRNGPPSKCGENWAGDVQCLPIGRPTKRMTTYFDRFKTCNFASVKYLKLKRVMNKLKLEAHPCCIEQTGDWSANWIH